ncbi:MAG: diguanylate cyclase domain-containing protein [Methylophilaceae bacterium]
MMPISQELLEAAELDRSTLTFKDAQLEGFYRQHDLVRLRRQARIALLVGGVLYGSYGLMDYLFIPSQDFIKALYLHVMALMIAFSVFALTYTPTFSRFNQPLLFIAGFFAGLGLLGKMIYLPAAAISLFYVGLIQITFWCHYFSGLRFVHSTAVGILLLIIFNFMFRDLPAWTLFSYDFFIASANILGAFTSYTGEKQNRILFLREKELDTERHLQHERALHDRLTGLPNRELLHDRIEQAIQYSIRNNQICAGLFLDLDKFKPINDTYGHQIGDQVLQEAAVRLKNATREVDTLCRLGGDEFFVLAQDINSLEAAEALAVKLQEQLESPLNIPNLPSSVTVSASIGICLFPYPNSSAIDVIRRADHAMYENKKMRKKTMQ